MIRLFKPKLIHEYMQTQANRSNWNMVCPYCNEYASTAPRWITFTGVIIDNSHAGGDTFHCFKCQMDFEYTNEDYKKFWGNLRFNIVA